MSADKVAEPDVMKVSVADMVVNYVPPFFNAMEEWFRALEAVKWASQLGATAKLRTTHARIYRAIDKLMREAWHKPQALMMLAFTETGDVLDLPSPRHVMDYEQGLVRFGLRDEQGGAGAFADDDPDDLLGLLDEAGR